MPDPPFLRHLALRSELAADTTRFPLCVPSLSELDLPFTTSVTFFVGENGSGKSTLLEAIAELCRLPVAGGGRNELSTCGE